jgi:hypothetical protein
MFSFSPGRSPLTSAFAARHSAAPARRRLFAPVETLCVVIARRARHLTSAVNYFSTPRRQDATIQNVFSFAFASLPFALNPFQLKGRQSRIGNRISGCG